MASLIDANDLAHVRRLGRKPVAALPCPWGIHPHVTRFALADGRLCDVFHVKPVYYETPAGDWRPMSEVAAYHGNRRIVLAPRAWGRVSPRFLRWLMTRQRLLGSALEFDGGLLSPERLEFAATLTAYPDPNPETTTVDGYVLNAAFVSWAATQGAATGTTANDSSTTFLVGSQDDSGLGEYDIWRGFTLFDTSALTAGATGVTATASFWATAKTNTDNDADDWINVVQSNPASNTALVTADFDLCGSAIDNPAEGSTRIDIGSITTGAYSDYALNATGLGWISLTGVTKLGLREGHDAIDSAMAVSTINRATFSSADNTGTSQDPKLVVTYTPGTGGLTGDMPIRPLLHLLVR